MLTGCSTRPCCTWPATRASAEVRINGRAHTAPRPGQLRNGCEQFQLRTAGAAGADRGAAARSARVPARGARGHDAARARAYLAGLRCRVQPQARREGVDRDDLAARVRRPGAQRAGALRAARGTAGRGCAGGGALDCRPPERHAAAALRPRGSAAALPAGDGPRRAVLLHRHERARIRAPTWPRSGRAPRASTAAGRSTAPSCGPPTRTRRT